MIGKSDGKSVRMVVQHGILGVLALGMMLTVPAVMARPVTARPPKGGCCYYQNGVHTNVCTDRVDFFTCSADGGLPVRSCSSGCPTLTPHISVEEVLFDDTNSQESEPVDTAPAQTSTGLAWTLLATAVFLAGL